MSSPRELLIHDAVLAAAVGVSGSNVPQEQHYRRDTLSYSDGRDKVPAVVVSRTPGRPVGNLPRLSWEEWSYPVTALLLDSAGGTVRAARELDWRVAWAETLFKALGGPSPFRDLEAEPDSPGVLNLVHWVDPDTLTVLDLIAFEQAGLWQSACSVVVTVRVPY